MPRYNDAHTRFMSVAILEAMDAFLEGEVPVGAVAVLGNEIIAAAHNQVEKLKDPTAHAEILVLRKASAVLSNWRLSEVTVYVTLEPCMMCLGALVLARITRLVYGATNIRMGFAEAFLDYDSGSYCFQEMDIIGGVLEDECHELLQQFFVAARKRRGTEVWS